MQAARAATARAVAPELWGVWLSHPSSAAGPDSHLLGGGGRGQPQARAKPVSAWRDVAAGKGRSGRQTELVPGQLKIHALPTARQYVRRSLYLEVARYRQDATRSYMHPHKSASRQLCTAV